MSRIDVESKVAIYKKAGAHYDYDEKKLLVKSVWNDSDKVLLAYGDTEIMVVAGDLVAALRNATNTGKNY